jgi:uncharacterized protein YcaQ
VASPALPAPELTLTPDDVRLMTLRAQGLIGTEIRRGGVPRMLRQLGAVQLDTISVLARSHELVAYARLGPIARERIERAYWHPRQPDAFEYWSHAACILPIEEWPYYEFRRRAFRARGMRWHEVPERACRDVLARLRAEGPLTATQLGGAKRGGEWWDWSETKIAVEWLLDTGDVICTRRTGWRRVYDLPDRVLPAELRQAGQSDADCITHLAAVTARALGVATRGDLLDYQRLRSYMADQAENAISIDEAAAKAGLVPVSVAGPPVVAWADPLAWADPEALAALSAPSPGRHRVTLLSPFDSLLWDRKRTLRMFEFEHSLEAYVPKAKRIHGYFAMPLLAGGQLVGRVDPVREGSTLVARQLSLHSAAAAPAMARALRDAAAWVGCDSIAVGQVGPARLEQRLRREVAALS